MEATQQPAPPWRSFSREAAAIEAIEHAIELFDEGRSLCLIRAVTHAGGLYFANRVRPNGEGNSAMFELTNLMKELSGPGFSEKWFIEHGWNVANSMKHFGSDNDSPDVVLSLNSVTCALMCAIADCGKATGRITEKMNTWRLRQMERLTADFALRPDQGAAFKKMLVEGQTRGLEWFMKR